MSDNKFLPSEAVATLDTSRVSNFFVKFCGSREAAVNFLENVIDEIDPSQSIKKKARTGTGKVEDNTVKNGNGLQPIGPTDSDAVSDIYYRDATDSLNHSFIMLAPNEISINSHMIGKGGSHIAEIKSKTGVRVLLERTELIPAHIFDRNVIFTGELKSICYAFQLMHNRIADKADGIFQGYSESTKIVVPLELVSHLIGKLGVSIKKVQSDSGARTEIQTEEEMHQQGYYYGRTITISGSLRQRAHAIYLIMRQLALDRELPPIWKGSPPLAIMSPHQAAAAAASNMSAHMGMNKNPAQMMAGLMTQPPQYNYPNPAATAAPTTFSYPYGNPSAATNSSPYTTNPAALSTAPPTLYPPPASGAPTMYTTNPQQQQQQPQQQQPPANMYANIPVPNASTYTYGAPGGGGGGGAAGPSAPPSYYSQPPPQQSQPQPFHHLQQPPTQQQSQHQQQQLAPPQQQQQQPQQQAHQPPPWLTTSGHKRAY